MAKRNKSAGFSLLEVLVAFSILALSLGVLMQIFSSGMRNAKITESYSQATSLAETILARVGTEISVTNGAHNGKEAGFQWAIDIAPYPLDDFISPPQNIDIYQVTARVAWSDTAGTHQIALSTLRLAPRQ